MNLEALALTVSILGTPTLIAAVGAWLGRRCWASHAGGRAAYFADCLLLTTPVFLAAVFAPLFLLLHHVGGLRPAAVFVIAVSLFAVALGMLPMLTAAWSRLRRASAASG